MNLHKCSIRYLILFLFIFNNIYIYIQISSKVIYLHQKYYSVFLHWLLTIGTGVINGVFSENSALVTQMVKKLHAM